jgi:hypothetical protein
MPTPIYDQVVTDMARYKASVERRTLEHVADVIRIKYPGKKRTKQTGEILDLIEQLLKRGLNG